MCNKVAVIVSGVCGVIWVCPFEYNCVYNLSPKKPLLLCKKNGFIGLSLFLYVVILFLLIKDSICFAMLVGYLSGSACFLLAEVS